MILEIYYCSLCSCQTTHEYKQSSEDRQRQLWRCTICNSYIDITIANFTISFLGDYDPNVTKRVKRRSEVIEFRNVI